MQLSTKSKPMTFRTSEFTVERVQIDLLFRNALHLLLLLHSSCISFIFSALNVTSIACGMDLSSPKP